MLIMDLLPSELTVTVLGSLHTVQDLLLARGVCRRWAQVISNDHAWRRYFVDLCPFAGLRNLGSGGIASLCVWWFSGSVSPRADRRSCTVLALSPMLGVGVTLTLTAHLQRPGLHTQRILTLTAHLQRPGLHAQKTLTLTAHLQRPGLHTQRAQRAQTATYAISSGCVA